MGGRCQDSGAPAPGSFHKAQAVLDNDDPVGVGENSLVLRVKGVLVEVVSNLDNGVLAMEDLSLDRRIYRSFVKRIKHLRAHLQQFLPVGVVEDASACSWSFANRWKGSVQLFEQSGKGRNGFGIFGTDRQPFRNLQGEGCLEELRQDH